MKETIQQQDHTEDDFKGELRGRDQLYKEVEDFLSSQKSADEVLDTLLKLKKEKLIETPTQLIENESLYPEPRTKEEYKENILVKLRKLVEVAELEESLSGKVTNLPRDLKELVKDVLVYYAPASIKIPSDLKIWEMLEILRDPSIFSERGFREISGHFEEESDEIWITIGEGTFSSSYGLRLEDESAFPLENLFPPERRSIDPDEQKKLKNPILFHTHAPGYSSLSSGDYDPIFGDIWHLEKFSSSGPFIERALLISENSTGKTIFTLLARIYSPEKPNLYDKYSIISSFNSRLKIEEMNKDLWDRMMYSEEIVKEIGENAALSEKEVENLRKIYKDVLRTD
jgi:hypothetical protein